MCGILTGLSVMFLYVTFSIVIQEYERTRKLIAEKKQDRQAHDEGKSTLLEERKTAMDHLALTKIAFLTYKYKFLIDCICL